jgi:hypothetical protein
MPVVLSLAYKFVPSQPNHTIAGLNLLKGITIHAFSNKKQEDFLYIVFFGA